MDTNQGLPVFLRDEDVAAFWEAERRIFDFMSDGKWHRAQDIIDASGQRSGLRRLRKLRGRPGVSIATRRPSLGSREFEYRMTVEWAERAAV